LFTIHIYIPRTTRTYIAQLHQSDVLRWYFNFMKSVTGISEDIMEKILKASNTYADYNKNYWDALKDTRNLIKNPFTKQYQHIKDLGGAGWAPPKPLRPTPPQNGRRRSSFLDGGDCNVVTLCKKKLHNFTEIKIWENIVHQVEIT
jgi:hypothetical protein